MREEWKGKEEEEEVKVEKVEGMERRRRRRRRRRSNRGEGRRRSNEVFQGGEQLLVKWCDWKIFRESKKF